MDLEKNSLSNKIVFRRLIEKDANKLFEIYSDKIAMKYRGSKVMECIEDAKSFISNQELKEKNKTTIRKGIDLKDKNELIGSVMYRFYKDKEGECEIGYSIGAKYWGQGLGKEIVRVLVESIRKNAEVKKIMAWSHKDNIASIKILEKNGFELVKQQDNTYLFQKKN